MKILKTKGWEEYELLDSGDGYRLERFGKFRFARPDPQAIWKRKLSQKEWDRVDASFNREANGKEKWVVKTSVPLTWEMHYRDIAFNARLTPFKHIGVFPEQILQWEWIKEKIENSKRPVNVLNLFAYTGIASLVAAKAGAKVTHVDASRPTIGWARDNQKISNLDEKPIRWILDDALKFVRRERNRGVKYDAIIMDPPVYGHGPTGEVWNFSDSFPMLLSECCGVLSENPLFVLVNAYAITSSAFMLENVLKDFLKDGNIEVGELLLEEKNTERALSTGIYGRWSKA